jgi:hypothetical protein
VKSMRVFTEKKGLGVIPGAGSTARRPVVA